MNLGFSRVDYLVDPGNLFQEAAGAHDGTLFGSDSGIFHRPVIPGRSCPQNVANATAKPQKPATKKLQRTEDPPQVVTGNAPQYIHPIPFHPPEPAPPQMVIRLQVTNHWLNRLPTLETLPQSSGHDASLSPCPR